MTSPQVARVARPTREELYEQVWSAPMQTLALGYGLSDVGLAKTCKRMVILFPGVDTGRRRRLASASSSCPCLDCRQTERTFSARWNSHRVQSPWTSRLWRVLSRRKQRSKAGLRI